MAIFPKVQRRAQQEIDAVVGCDRLVTYDDLPSLPYIQAVQREVFRWRPVLPLSVPHATSADDVYKGYYIPKGTRSQFTSLNIFTYIFHRSNSDQQHMVSSIHHIWIETMFIPFHLASSCCRAIAHDPKRYPPNQMNLSLTVSLIQMDN